MIVVAPISQAEILVELSCTTRAKYFLVATEVLIGRASTDIAVLGSFDCGLEINLCPKKIVRL